MILAAQTFTVTVGGTRIDPVSNQAVVKMDEGNSPWLTAALTVARPADAVLALLDPARGQVVTVTLVAPVSLVLTFKVQGRTFDPTSDTVVLQLVSDEYSLLTYAPSANVDLRGKSYQASVRAVAAQVVSQVLGKATAVQLAAGTADRTFTTYAAAENLFPDPNVITASNFTASSSPAGQYSTSVDTTLGVNAYQVLGSGTQHADWVQMSNNVTVPASGGQQYTGSVLPYYRGNGPVTGSLYLNFYDSNAVLLKSFTVGLGALPSSSQSPVRRGITATAPAGSASVKFVLRGTSAANPYSVCGAQWSFIEGDGLDTDAATYAFFSGDSPTAGSGYTYAWSGGSNASSSTRTPVVNRDPASLLWTPQDKADGFLRPILEASGLRLFQNETGAFVLADNGYKVPGQVVMQQGSTLYGASESTSVSDTDADGFPLNADAVIVSYAWTDVQGVQQTAIDVAKAGATYSRPYVLQKTDTPYPGPGQARFLLTRLLARTRRIDTTGRPDWTGRPGMSAVVSLPHRPTASGYVAAIEWDLAAATMTVTSKNLVTTPSGSVGNAPITQTIGSVSGTIGAYTN